MNSIGSVWKPDASGQAPKQVPYIPKLTLNDGHEIPMLGYGLGTANYKRGGGGFDDSVSDITQAAIKHGWYHLDGAEVYGNETEMGTAISRAGVDREKLFVTAKINGEKKKDTREAFDSTLSNLGLSYVDLYLIHGPFFADSDEELQQKWSDMEAILESGKARSIGVSNFLPHHIEAILKTAKVTPAVNQVEFHPYLQHEDGFLDFHRKHKIAVTAYAPLTPVHKQVEDTVPSLYKMLAKKYGVTVSEIGLRWCIDQGIVVLTTTSKEDKLQEYMNKIIGFKLTPKEIQEVNDAGRNAHYRGYFAQYYDANDKR